MDFYRFFPAVLQALRDSDVSFILKMGIGRNISQFSIANLD
jgi:hypothetical protein